MISTLAQTFSQPPYNVHDYVVWNEMFGFEKSHTTLTCPTTTTAPDPAWDYADYDNFYRDVYTAIKTQDSNALVGGPYAPMQVVPACSPDATDIPSLRGAWGAIDYRSLETITNWLQYIQNPQNFPGIQIRPNQVAADFIAFDGRTAQEGNVPYGNESDATQVFQAVDQWVQQQTSLPIWWTEWYARVANQDVQPDPSQPSAPSAEWTAMSTEALMYLATSGASVASMWDPEYCGASEMTNGCLALLNPTNDPTITPNLSATPGLWLYNTTPDGVSGIGATALAPVFQALKNDFSGTDVTMTRPTAGVELLQNTSHYIAVDVDGRKPLPFHVGNTLVKLQPFKISIDGTTIQPVTS